MSTVEKASDIFILYHLKLPTTAAVEILTRAISVFKVLNFSLFFRQYVDTDLGRFRIHNPARDKSLFSF
jgi:hypothetical protein